MFTQRNALKSSSFIWNVFNWKQQNCTIGGLVRLAWNICICTMKNYVRKKDNWLIKQHNYHSQVPLMKSKITECTFYYSFHIKNRERVNHCIMIGWRDHGLFEDGIVRGWREGLPRALRPFWRWWLYVHHLDCDDGFTQTFVTLNICS